MITFLMFQTEAGYEKRRKEEQLVGAGVSNDLVTFDTCSLLLLLTLD